MEVTDDISPIQQVMRLTKSMRTSGQGYPTPSLTSHPKPPYHVNTLIRTHNNNSSIVNARFLHFQLERQGPTDGPRDGQSLLKSCVALTKKQSIISCGHLNLFQKQLKHFDNVSDQRKCAGERSY